MGTCTWWITPVNASATTAATSWIEPGAGYGFVSAAFASAQHSIDLSMYELEDPTIEKALVTAQHRGVQVHVLLNAAYYGTSHNQAGALVLTSGHVAVRWAPTNQIFHAKYFIIDGSFLYIGTGNFTPQYYSSTRDVWYLDTTASDVSAATTVFDHDFAGTSGEVPPASNLVWSPGSESTLMSLIASAKSSLYVENEEMSDSWITTALESRAKAGVHVTVIMTASSEWNAAFAQLRQAGVKVVNPPSSTDYIHAKLICADCGGRTQGRLFLGSENFSVTSLLENRELGVIVSASSSVGRAVYATMLADAAN